jgi:hypothetical protein
MMKRRSLENNTKMSVVCFSSSASDDHELLSVDYDQTP